MARDLPTGLLALTESPLEEVEEESSGDSLERLVGKDLCLELAFDISKSNRLLSPANHTGSSSQAPVIYVFTAIIITTSKPLIKCS